MIVNVYIEFGEYATKKCYKEGKTVGRHADDGTAKIVEHNFKAPVGRGPNVGTQTSIKVHRDKSGKMHEHPKGAEAY